MSKVAVVYWSGTGNTQAMAEAVAEGARQSGAEVSVIPAEAFHASDTADFDAIAFGCPAMGAETLEESVFQPMWDDVKGSLKGKKIGLFGSWGWGGGLWMEDWSAEADTTGADLVGKVTCSNAPDDTALMECRALGKSLA